VTLVVRYVVDSSPAGATPALRRRARLLLQVTTSPLTAVTLPPHTSPLTAVTPHLTPHLTAVTLPPHTSPHRCHAPPSHAGVRAKRPRELISVPPESLVGPIRYKTARG
jgi:hypothetical protein